MMRTSGVAALLGVLTSVSGCLSDLDPHVPESAPIVAGGVAREGPASMRAYGCGSCHTIPGVAGAHAQVGPPLTGFANRHYIGGRAPNNPDELVRWILNPQEIKPGTAMPNLGVDAQDARNMAAYLYTLR